MTKQHKSLKQFTLDNLPDPTPKDAIEIIKQPQDEPIVITQIESVTKEDEIVIKIAFKLPAKKAFARVQADLWFDRQQVGSALVRLLQGPLATAESEFSTVLDMRGISPGRHIIGVELYGLWDSMKLCRAIREVIIEYRPVKQYSRLIKIPSVRSVAGADLAVASQVDKDIYRNIEENLKRENSSKRDDW